eukprot:TRINITY_DN73844_c0_g1_i1.p1 TRINITY_DN73844_c0_g1~~TRINITY_DN73844_c0_g1_i1.p1  ORF type:complete len:316 (-),score=41.83 TRINITY_DN73844_c0_g1_i1:136-1083(-)
MKRSGDCFVFLHFFTLYKLIAADGCHKPVANAPESVKSKRSHEDLDPASLPAYFDWRNVAGRNLVTPIRNQQLPRICGSCWAQAATSALSDRLFIQTEGRGVATLLAPQVLLDLNNLAPQAGGCNGGDAELAYDFIRRYGIADESCSPYQGVDVSTWGEGNISVTARMCRVCDWDGTCKFTSAGPRYHISEHGRVTGEFQMMAEIYKRGPIACAVHARNTPFNSYTGVPEVLVVNEAFNATTHQIVILGWGETREGLKYWIGKNSYGTLWGQEGFFKLRRGHDDLKLETTPCAWAVPSTGRTSDAVQRQPLTLYA